MKEYSASLRDRNPSNGFFATVPSLERTDLVLRELRYTFDTLHADGATHCLPVMPPRGVTWATQSMCPIGRNSAAVRLSCSSIPSITKDSVFVTTHCRCLPSIGRTRRDATAMDLILKRRPQQFPNVKIILSHGGCTLAALITRASMIELPEFGGAMSAEDII
ncbi:hypothetical protein J3459_022275 [Metarhizium acridum]|nr:hypothetical protein J3459_022275 [Metarhizium acridum]